METRTIIYWTDGKNPPRYLNIDTEVNFVEQIDLPPPPSTSPPDTDPDPGTPPPPPDPETGLFITDAHGTSSQIVVSFESDEPINSLEYTLDGGQTWQAAPNTSSPLTLNRSNNNPVYIILRVNGSVLSKTTTQVRSFTSSQSGFTFAAPTIGNRTGSYNIHGINDDTSMSPPSTNPADWQVLNSGDPIVDHLSVIGKRKIDPVGFYSMSGNLTLFYNSGWDDYSDYRGGTVGFNREASNQAGSLIAFNNSFGFTDFDTNPVLSWPQYQWQGRNRVNPYALVYHPIDQYFYCWYGDFAEGGDGDKYPGRRALGLAKSKDLISWVYLSVNRPYFHIEDVYNLAPQDFPNTNFNSSGRLYAFGATWHNGYIYFLVGGSINGPNWTSMLRAQSVQGPWERVEWDGARPMPIHIQGKWYLPRNILDPDDSSKRAIAIRVYDSLDDPNPEQHFVFKTGFTASAGVSRQLFAYNGTWYVAYRQSDADDYRDMHIARQI